MKKIITIILIAIFLSGCATAPRRADISFMGSTVSIEGVAYVPADILISEYRADSKWDAVARRLIVEKKNKEAVFCVGADVALINGNPEKMPAPVKMYSGEIMIPYDFASCQLRQLFLPVRRAPSRKKPAYYAGKYTIRTIVIDAGHGGKDPGAISPAGIREKDVVLNIAKRLKAYLQKEGIRVILTRDRDKFVSLWKRANIANQAKADFFISIHANAARQTSVNGVEVFYLSDAADNYARSTAAAENASVQYEESSFSDRMSPKSAVAATLGDMLSTENRAESIELAQCVCRGISMTLGAKDRGIKTANFYVLKGAEMPSILIEAGFLSNAQEAAKLKTSSYQEKLAKAIADGILLYRQRYEKTDGFTK